MTGELENEKLQHELTELREAVREILDLDYVLEADLRRLRQLIEEADRDHG